jgi:hypothetical protein
MCDTCDMCPPRARPFFIATGISRKSFEIDSGYAHMQWQVQLTGVLPHWHLPARYYTRRVPAGGASFITLIFIDTSPCYLDYRGTDRAGWDPCGTVQ